MSGATRRGFLTGALGLLAAPAIVRVASLMPVSAPRLVRIPTPFLELTGAEDLEAVIYGDLCVEWQREMLRVFRLETPLLG